MKLNRTLVASTDTRQVRISIQLKDSDAIYQSHNVKDRMERITDEVHEVLATHFHVTSIKVK